MTPKDLETEVQTLRELAKRQALLIKQHISNISELHRKIAQRDEVINHLQERQGSSQLLDDSGDPIALDKLFSGDI